MATHFNAFISYRHSPRDSEVAQRIHRQLERFRIPKAIQKATGIKKIDRIFRDKEELPLSVNLSDDINEALVNSDFLIVICSPRFQQSQWCMREIDLFLQTHPVERVLIVLAEGEPDDVVPPVLTRDREPLCCDFRMKPRKAKNIELPRLVSAILGCRYDELRQRQRQYRMRRTIAFFSAALVATVSLMIYFIHTSIQIQKANDDLHAANVQIQAANVQIQDNLDQALRNQSEYLASASDTSLDDGDRLTAIALALEALPDENGDRPYVAAAEMSLSNALDTYESSDDIVAQGAYIADNLVEDFKVTEDGEQIYILDSRNVITVWDVNSFQKQHTVDLGGYNIEDFYITRQGNILFAELTSGEPVRCADLTGKLLWEAEQGNNIAFLDGRSVLLLMKYDFLGADQILFLDPDTGEQVREPLDVEHKESDAWVSGFLQMDYQSGQPLTLRYAASNNMTEIVFADMETGSLVPACTIDTSFGSGRGIDAAAVIQEGKVLLMCGDGSGWYNGSIYNMEVTSRDRADLWCYDGKTGKRLWESEIITYVYSWDSVVEPIPGSDWVLLQSGNTFLVLDSRTGEEIAQCQTVSQPLTVQVYENKASGIMENGDMYHFYYEDNDCSSLDIIDGTVDMAELNHGVFVHAPLEMQVTGYWYDEKDQRVPVACDTELVPTFNQMAGDSLAICNYDTMVMLDTRQQKQRWWLELGYGYDALGFSADGSEFWMWNRYDEYAVAFSAADGSQRQLEIPLELEDLYTNLESNMYLAEDRLFYMLKADGKMQLLQTDLQTGKTVLDLSLEPWIEEEKTYSATSRILLIARQYAWIYREDGTLSIVNLESGNIKLLAEELVLTPSVTYSADLDQVLVGIGNELRLTTPGGAPILKISLDDVKPVSMCFFNQELLALCDDGDLYRFDRTGKRLSQTSMQIFNTFGYEASKPVSNPMDMCWWPTENGDLIVNVFGAGNVVECDNWQVKAYVPDLSAYLPESDTMLCISGQKLYAYSRYNTRQLMEMARKELGDFRLSEEVRDYYGLTEEKA